MKTNYIIMILTFFINLFMALSLNSFSSSTLYLPMMFLYFLSGLAAFIDKIAYYKNSGQKLEEKISWICFSVCFLVVCFYIANSLGFIEIIFQCNYGTYNVLMQGIQNSFFTFNSVNITPFIFLFAFMLPFAYPVLCLISYLREQGLTMEQVLYIHKNNKLKLFGLLILSVIIGSIGMGICHLKYCKSDCKYGSPQYSKYFCALFILSLCILCVRFFLRHKNDKLSTHQQEEQSSTSKQP